MTVVATTGFEVIPDEIRLPIVRNVITEACQNRDYRTLFSIFQVCRQWRAMADEILGKPFIAAGLIPIREPTEIYRTLAQHPCNLISPILGIRQLYEVTPEQWKLKEQHQQIRIIAILMAYILPKEKPTEGQPLNCLVRIMNECMHHTKFMSNNKEVASYQKFLKRTARNWLYISTPPSGEMLNQQVSIEAESFYQSKFDIIEKDPTHPLSLFFFQRFYGKFNLPAFQQNMLVASGSLRINWVEQPCLTLKLHCPLTRDREKLFNDPTNLDPNQTFVNTDPHRYTSEHIAFMLVQTVFSTRKGLDDLATMLKEKLNVNICRLENFIKACIQLNAIPPNTPAFDPTESLFLELLSFVRKQNQFDRNQFVSHIVRILNQTDSFSPEVKREIFKSIIPVIPDFNATFTQYRLLPDEERLAEEVSYLTYVCKNEAVFGIEIIEELLSKKTNSSFSPIPADELEGLLLPLIFKFFEHAFTSNDQQLFERNRNVIHQLLEKAYKGSPKILESKKFLSLAWFILPEILLIEEKLQSVLPAHVFFTQDYEVIRQQGIESVDPVLWRLFSLADVSKIALWCTYWSIDARAFVALYNAGKNALFPIQNTVAFAVLKELLKQPQHSALNILRDVFSSWNYTFEDFTLLQEDLKAILERRPTNQSLLTSFLENPVTVLNPAILDQFYSWGATLPANAIKSLSPISLQNDLISILKEKFGCAEPQNLKRASQEKTTLVSKKSKRNTTQRKNNR